MSTSPVDIIVNKSRVISNMINDSEFGARAELFVAQYLKKKGYVIQDRNYKKKWGEIDIIASKDGVLIFIEVKAGKKNILGFEPEHRVNLQKIRRLKRTVESYLAINNLAMGCDWQIDVVSLVYDQDRGVVKIRHFKNIET